MLSFFYVRKRWYNKGNTCERMREMDHQEKARDLLKLQDELEVEGHRLYTKSFYGTSGFFIGIKNETEELTELQMSLDSNRVFVREHKQIVWDLAVMLIGKIEELMFKWGEREIRLEGDDRIQTLGYLNFKTFCMKELGKETVLTYLVRGITSVMKACEKEMDSFSYGIYEMDGRTIDVEFRTFYQKRTMICFIDENNTIHININKKNYDMPMDEVEVFFKKELEKEEKVQKLQSVFSRPKHPYLFEFLEENNDGGILEKEGEIASVLSKRYPYETIEKMAKEKVERKEGCLLHRERNQFVSLIPFGDILLYIDEGNVVIKENHEQAVLEFKEKVLEWTLGSNKLKKLENMKNMK